MNDVPEVKEEVNIDPKSTPDGIYILGCRILNSRIDNSKTEAERRKKDE